MQLVDSHCHLDDQQFSSDLDGLIARAQAAGVKFMLSIGTGDGPPDLECAVRMAERYPFVFATAGVHPNDVEKLESNTFENLAKVLVHPKVKAMGEIGLDYYWQVPKQLQRAAFERQLAMAVEARLPVVIHTRDAWPDTLDVLKTAWQPANLPGIMHCFTGDPVLARQCLDMGFYLAFGGVATYPKSADVREAARITPADRLLLETDAPYLAPVPHRGKRNEPAFVRYTAETLADVRGESVDDLAEQTTQNFKRLFNIDDQSPIENLSAITQAEGR